MSLAVRHSGRRSTGVNRDELASLVGRCYRVMNAKPAAPDAPPPARRSGRHKLPPIADPLPLDTPHLLAVIQRHPHLSDAELGRFFARSECAVSERRRRLGIPDVRRRTHG